MARAPMSPHGGSGEDFLGQYHADAPRPWIDLSTGINPWPYSHGEIPDAVFDRLPLPSLYESCRNAAAGYFAADPASVAILPGSQAAIALLPRLFAPTTVAVLQPGYSEHEAAWAAQGHVVAPISAAAAKDEKANILVITNPNNPDGHAWTRREIAQLGAARTAQGQWLVVDEAFADLIPADSIAGHEGNLIVLRSFGKFFGLAGLRLGFLIGPSELARQMATMLGPWAVSGPALAIGAHAYADQSWQAQTRVRLAAASLDLRKLLQSHGLTDVGGTDLFRLMEHANAPALFDSLCRHGIHVRRFADYPHWLRFGLPGDDVARARLDEALRAWRQSA